MVAKQNLGAKEKILEQKKKDLTAKRRAISKLQHFIDTIRRPVQSEIELPDGTMLNIDNAHTYLKECQDIINEKEEREALLASLKEENIKLGETLNSIKDRFGSNIDEILEARHKIQAIDEESNEVNMAKGQTLQQISEIVTEMTETLKTERENLEPMVSVEDTYL
jgi:chromosome segregation ATPase